MRKRKASEALTLERLRQDEDWRQSFGESCRRGPEYCGYDHERGDEQWISAYNVVGKCDPCPLDSDVDLSVPTRADVIRIVAAEDGENDVDNWLGVFELKDGRYLLVDSWCDYTGWD